MGGLFEKGVYRNLPKTRHRDVAIAVSASPTRFEHQRRAVQQWGLRDFDSTTEQQLIEHLQARTNATLSRSRLKQAAREWLYWACVAILRPRTITVLVRGVVQSVAVLDHRYCGATCRIHRAGFHQGTSVAQIRRHHDSPGMVATTTPSAFDEFAARVNF